MSEIYFFPDTTVLRNFAAVDAMSLLEEYLATRGRTAQAVRMEIVAQSRSIPALAAIDLRNWFGDAIEIVGGPAIEGVEHLRRDRFGGIAERPREHLGESQTLYLLTMDTPYRGSVFVTDDFEAHRVSSTLNTLTRDTVDVLVALAARGSISDAEVVKLIEDMHAAGRTLRRWPQSARELPR